MCLSCHRAERTNDILRNRISGASERAIIQCSRLTAKSNYYQGLFYFLKKKKTIFSFSTQKMWALLFPFIFFFSRDVVVVVVVVSALRPPPNSFTHWERQRGGGDCLFWFSDGSQRSTTTAWPWSNARMLLTLAWPDGPCLSAAAAALGVVILKVCEMRFQLFWPEPWDEKKTEKKKKKKEKEKERERGLVMSATTTKRRGATRIRERQAG